MQPRPAQQGRTVDSNEVADGGQVQRQDAASDLTLILNLSRTHGNEAAGGGQVQRQDAAPNINLNLKNLNLSRTHGDEAAGGGQVQRQDAAPNIKLNLKNLNLSRTHGDEVADGGHVQRQDVAGAPAQQAELVAAVLALLPVVLHVQRIGFRVSFPVRTARRTTAAQRTRSSTHME